jgi:hypothetical protein
MTTPQGHHRLPPWPDSIALNAEAILDAAKATKAPIKERIAAALRAAADRAEDLIGDTEHPKFTEGVLAAAHFLDLTAAELEGEP